MMPLSGVRISWLGHGEEARFCAVGRIGLVAGVRQRALALGAVGDVAADALQLGGLAGIEPHQALAPGHPARAERRGDLLVVNAGAVALAGAVTLLDHVEIEAGADQGSARLSREFAIGVIGEGDAALMVAQHDQVALRFEQAARPLSASFSSQLRSTSASLCWASARIRLLTKRSRMLSVARPRQASANRKLAPTAKAWGS